MKWRTANRTLSHICEQLLLLNVEPSTCVAIEDSPTGVASAHAAGCQVIGVPNMKPLEHIDGVRIVSSLTEIDAATLWTT